MGFLNEEDRKRITEEEEIRSQVRRKYEQKSSGLAGVLSTLCPGLGQVYNGQIGKASLFFFCFIVGLTVLSLGATTLIKGPSSGASFNLASSAGISKEKPVEMNEEGIVTAEVNAGITKPDQAKQTPETEKLSREQKTVIKALALTGLGAIIAILAALFAIRDAIRTARRKNQE
ncbi:MAG: hypothetical protein NTY10_01605 [Candidatus Omnitrophica bacterium]|nr:hypothetical protein [Candidatus Omnitrophota bacterium]